MEFEINQEIIQNNKGNPCFILPKGTMIYFGSKRKLFEDTKITFFGFEKAVAEKYGHIIHKFKTTKNLYLLSFMDLEKTHPFYKKATDDMKKLLDTTFTIGTLGEKFRVTTGESDVKIMEYLCETKEQHGCQGYAMNGKYRGDALGGKIHAEMALCPPLNDVLVSLGYDEGVKSPPRAPNRKGKKRRANREANNDEQLMSFGSMPFFNMKNNNNNNNTAYYTPPPGSPIKPPAAGPKGFIDNGYETPGGKKKRTKKNKKLKKEKRKTKRNKKSKKSKKN